MTTKLWEKIASALQAAENCRKAGNLEWYEKHRTVIRELCNTQLPRGSGFSGTNLLFEKSKPTRLVFETSFHHMGENGYYDGWTEHTVIVTPEFGGEVNVRVTGKERDGIKDYIAQCFYDAQTKEELEEERRNWQARLAQD